MPNKQIHQLPDITFPVDPTQSYIVADMYDTDSNTHKTVRIETTELIPTLKTTLEGGNITDGHNINITSMDGIISTPLADENQEDVKISFISGLIYKLDFVPIEDIPDTNLYVQPIGGNGTYSTLELVFNSTGNLIDIKIADRGYDYLVGDVLTILESESGIPDFSVTIIETMGSVTSKTEANWAFTGPKVSDGVGNSRLIITDKINLYGSNGVSIGSPKRLSLGTDTTGIFVGENFSSISTQVGDTETFLMIDPLQSKYGTSFGKANSVDDSHYIFTVNDDSVKMTAGDGGGNAAQHSVESGLIKMSVVGAGDAQILMSALPLSGNGSILMSSKGKFESIVDSGFVSSSIVQNASNITTTSDEIWMFAGTSGIEMSNTSILNYSTNITSNTDEFKVNDLTGADTFLQISPDGTLIDVSGSQSFKVVNLPVFADNAAAVIAGLEVDRIYKTATGELRIVV